MTVNSPRDKNIKEYYVPAYDRILAEVTFSQAEIRIAQSLKDHVWEKFGNSMTTYNKSEKLFGFYSEEHEQMSGSVFYSTPDGKKVVVTCVDISPDAPGYAWSDKKLVGEVVKYQGKALWAGDPRWYKPIRWSGPYFCSSLPSHIFELDKTPALDPVLSEIKPQDKCNCSGRDLLFFGHKCGRTS